MHDISATILVSTDKCNFFSVIGIGPIRKSGQYLKADKGSQNVYKILDIDLSANISVIGFEI